MPRFVRHRRAVTRRSVPQPVRKTEERRELANNEGLSAIAAQLRALIPVSTDPAWLERMAREVENRAVRR